MRVVRSLLGVLRMRGLRGLHVGGVAAAVIRRVHPGALRSHVARGWTDHGRCHRTPPGEQCTEEHDKPDAKRFHGGRTRQRCRVGNQMVAIVDLPTVTRSTPLQDALPAFARSA